MFHNSSIIKMDSCKKSYIKITITKYKCSICSSAYEDGTASSLHLPSLFFASLSSRASRPKPGLWAVCEGGGIGYSREWPRLIGHLQVNSQRSISQISEGIGIYISDYRLLSDNPGCPGCCAYIKDGDSSSEVWCMGEGPYTPDYTCPSTTETPGNDVFHFIWTHSQST